MGIKERKAREKEQRRVSIIDAAQKMFFSKGIDETTMDDIAAQAELAKGTLYLYFKSKEDILFDLTMRGTEMLTRYLRDAVKPEESGRENLVSIGWAFIAYSRENKEFFRLYLHFQTIDMKQLAIPQEKLSRFFIKYTPFGMLMQLIEKGIRDGSLRAGISVKNTAATLWSALLGILIVLDTRADVIRIFEVEADDLVKTSFDILINGLAKN